MVTLILAAVLAAEPPRSIVVLREPIYAAATGPAYNTREGWRLKRLAAQQERAGRRLEAAGCFIGRTFSHLPMMVVSGDPAIIARDPDVLAVQPDRRVSASRVEGGALMRADVLRASGGTGEGVGVAVIDTGIDATHPELAGKVVYWADFTEPSGPYGMAELDNMRPGLAVDDPRDLALCAIHSAADALLRFSVGIGLSDCADVGFRSLSMTMPLSAWSSLGFGIPAMFQPGWIYSQSRIKGVSEVHGHSTPLEVGDHVVCLDPVDVVDLCKRWVRTWNEGLSNKAMNWRQNGAPIAVDVDTKIAVWIKELTQDDSASPSAGQRSHPSKVANLVPAFVTNDGSPRFGGRIANSHRLRPPSARGGEARRGVGALRRADFILSSGTGVSQDENGHGTACAGIIAGTAGMAPLASLWSYRVLDANGMGYDSSILAALNDVYAHRLEHGGVRVVSMSLGGDSYPGTDCDAAAPAYVLAIGQLRRAEIVTFVASGNEAEAAAVGVPACASPAVAVGAVYDTNIGGAYFGFCEDAITSADKVTCYSNGGPALDILAPSHCAHTTAPGGRYEACFGGTSAATPYAAGVAAQALSVHPTATVDQLVQALRETGASVLDSRNGRTCPRVDAVAASARLGTLVLRGRYRPSPVTPRPGNR